MKLKWLGHSCFLLTSTKGVRILTDPCDQTTGYRLAPVEVDAVTISHDHFDHNYLPIAKGDHVVCINTLGEHQVGDVKITGVHTFHDPEQGALRGENIVYVFEIDGLRVVHLGDLGHIPSQETVAALGHVDVLMIPVGGVYTIDHVQAQEVARMLQPKVLIPMHYKTDVATSPIQELSLFLDLCKNATIHRMRQSEVELSPESLGDARIIVLDYEKFE